MTKRIKKITVIGAGNLGLAIAEGLAGQEVLPAKQITVTRRKKKLLTKIEQQGFSTSINNSEAVKGAEMILVVVGPQETESVLREIAPALDPANQIIVSAVTGVEVNRLKACLPAGTRVVRIMPNLAVSVGNSMTCLYADPEDREARLQVEEVMNQVGTYLAISEDLLTPATALCASGLAFFLRSIRAAAQGGTEIGFHAEDAIRIAAQTALGAASLLQHSGSHPERCIDKVTTPKGITISGLNEMEHKGFSSSMIRGIVTSANKVAELTRKKES